MSCGFDSEVRGAAPVAGTGPAPRQMDPRGARWASADSDANRRSRGPTMTREKKAEANRRNALQSTGPKSTEGKARVARNALRHGLRADVFPILPGESAE